MGGSGGSRDDYTERFNGYRSLTSDDSRERERAERERSERVNESRRRIVEDRAPPPPKRDTKEVYKKEAV